MKFKEEKIAEQTTENSEEVLKGSYPCGKQCAYCQLLSKSQGQIFQSNSNKKIFKIRQCITCKSRNIIYLVTCIKCKLQGVGHSTHFGKRISNYFSHIKKGTHDCEISTHFIEHHGDTWISDYGRNSDFEIKAIAQLENPPRRKKELEERLRDFEGYWQLELNTIQPHGLNFRNELKEAFFRSRK